jgi:hypothetical protein
MPTQYTVVQGDCLSSIAAANGFRDWHTIYDDPANEDFRKLRPDPNVIYAGDVLAIPDKAQKTLAATTGQAATFTVKSPQTSLRLRFDDAGDLSYSLQIGDAPATSGDVLAGAVLQVPIPSNATEAQMWTWPKSFASAEEAGDAAINWVLVLGGLDPIETVRGIQARLKNLGYDPGAVGGDDWPNTQAAIKEFQGDNGLVVDGICGPKTTDALRTAYGM